MKDSDARGLVLRRLYDIREKQDYANINDFGGLDLESKTLGRMLEQLAEQNLIKWNPKKGSMGVGYLALMAKITAYGADVIEGNIPAPISISVDNSVSVHGSQGIQIGGQGNVQNITMDVGKLMNAVDGGAGTMQEREEAKSLLKRVIESPIAKVALDWWFKSHTGAG